MTRPSDTAEATPVTAQTGLMGRAVVSFGIAGILLVIGVPVAFWSVMLDTPGWVTAAVFAPAIVAMLVTVGFLVAAIPVGVKAIRYSRLHGTPSFWPTVFTAVAVLVGVPGALYAVAWAVLSAGRMW